MTDRIDRTERLLNLVICLMAAPMAVSRAQIQRDIPGYSSSASPAAFERMFERDKDELRSMGIPVETVTDANGEVLGYRIPQDRYRLEELDLTLPERAAVAVAAQVWGQAVMAPLAGTAVRKLESASMQNAVWSPAGLRGSIELTTSDAALLPIMSAIRLERVITFDYRTPADAQSRERTVSPWGLRSTRGAWMLIGHDHDRQAVRTFRLSRITSAVTVSASARAVGPPHGFDAAASGPEAGEEASVRARVRVTPGRAASLRRLAVEGQPDPWSATELVVEGASIEQLASVICACGTDAVALEPVDLVDEVRASLSALGGDA